MPREAGKISRASALFQWYSLYTLANFWPTDKQKFTAMDTNTHKQILIWLSACSEKSST